MWDTFTVRIILNGLMIKVGCQRLYFNSPQALANALDDYIENPNETIKRWRDTPYQKISEGCSTQVSQVDVPVDDRYPPPPEAPRMETASSATIPRDSLRINPSSNIS